MSDETDEHQDVTDIETALRSLRPQPSRIARDRLMFLAGRLSISNVIYPTVSSWHRWIWPSVVAASLIAAFSLGFLLATRSLPPAFVQQRELIPVDGLGRPAPLVTDSARQQISSDAPQRVQMILPGPVGVGQQMFPAVAISPADFRKITNQVPSGKSKKLRMPLIVGWPGDDVPMMWVIIPDVVDKQ